MADPKEQARYRERKGVKRIDVELTPDDVRRLDAVAQEVADGGRPSRRAAIIALLDRWDSTGRSPLLGPQDDDEPK